MEENRNGEERFPLDDAAIETLAELSDNVKAVQTGAEMARRAVLTYFCRQHKVQGQIRLAENGRELVIRREPQQQGVQQ